MPKTLDMGVRPMIATFDIETTGLTADADTILAAVIKPWMGEAKLYREDMYMRPRRSENPEMVTEIITELAKYPILIAHNGVRFDRPWLNTLAVMGGLDIILNPFGKIIDPVRLARKHLKFNYNSLEKLSEALGTRARKIPLTRQVWLRATLDGDKDALDQICEHCVADVDTLEEVAYICRPFIRDINAWGSD